MPPTKHNSSSTFHSHHFKHRDEIFTRLSRFSCLAKEKVNPWKGKYSTQFTTLPRLLPKIKGEWSVAFCSLKCLLDSWFNTHMASVTIKPPSTVKGFFHDLKTWPKHTPSFSGFSGSAALSHWTWWQTDATEFITKAWKNTFPMTQYARSQNQTDLPNHLVRRLHSLLKLPLHGYSSVLGIKIPKTRPAIQQMQWQRVAEFHLSAEISPMEYDCDLKTYCYQNGAKGSHHNSSWFYRNFLNENKWKKHQ